jgi:hypothetical protein
MTGGENRPGSWTLKTEKLPSGRARTFDSYDPFGGKAEGNFVGDGVLARVMLNDRQIWPTKLEDRAWFWQHRDWRYVANATAPVPVESSAHVVAGDKVVFVLNKYATTGADTTVFDPVIAYSDGERHKVRRVQQSTRPWRLALRILAERQSCPPGLQIFGGAVAEAGGQRPRLYVYQRPRNASARPRGPSAREDCAKDRRNSTPLRPWRSESVCASC